MIDMLNRVLMALDPLIDDPVLVVNISSKLPSQVAQWRHAFEAGSHDFVIYLMAGRTLNTNRKFACMLFEAIKRKAEFASSEAERSFYNLDDVQWWELNLLIMVMCGYEAPIRQSTVLRLFSIANEYQAPTPFVKELIAYPSRRVRDDLAVVKNEGDALQEEIQKERMRLFLEYTPPETEPIRFGYTEDSLNADEVRNAKVGMYYCYIPWKPTPRFHYAALLVSDISDGMAYVRFYDKRASNTVVKKVSVESLYTLLNFDNVQPCTLFPTLGRYTTRDLWPRDLVKNSPAIGHFVMRRHPEHNELSMALFLGVFRKDLIFVLYDGKVVLEFVRLWDLVESVRGDETREKKEHTRLIVNAPPLPGPCEYRKLDTDVEIGAHYGCTRSPQGHTYSNPKIVLCLGIADHFHVNVILCDHTEQVYIVDKLTLRSIQLLPMCD
jgi:hypothetical protein